MFELSFGLILIEFAEEAKQNVCGIETSRHSMCRWLNEVLPWRPKVSPLGHWCQGLQIGLCLHFVPSSHTYSCSGHKAQTCHQFNLIVDLGVVFTLNGWASHYSV